MKPEDYKPDIERIVADSDFGEPAGLLERLRRRKIVQWSAAYLAAAWLILQLTEVLTELLEVGPETGKVRSVAIEAVDEVPAGVEVVSEEEPWWRLLGCPLARVEAGEVGAQGIRLQFRADHENPRIIVLRPSGSEVQVSLEPTNRS